MERLLVEFARHADRARFDLHFVSLTGRGRVADELEALGWGVTAMHEPPGLRPGMVGRLAGLFRRLGADAVHAHNTKPLIYCGPAARLAGVPRVLYTRHGQRHNARRGESLLYRLAVRCVNYAVCVSDDSARLCAREGIGRHRVRKIWNGIDLSRFSFTGPDPSGPAVMVGRLSPEKNVETLLRAVPLVCNRLPDFRLDIAGIGVCLGPLKRLSEELGTGSAVRFLGEVGDVPRLLSQSSALVLPSWTEGISLTLLEAMARGLPVVATRVGGNPEVVNEGETGLLVKAGDAAELAEAILRLRLHPEDARRMGEEGRRRVERFFDVRQMVRAYESLYLQAVAARCGGRAAGVAEGVGTA
jgi:glycosyltransferase involved in cell wall biosynthesis